MKRIIFATILAIAGWFSIQAQSSPAPEKYTELLEQVALLDDVRGEFLMNATMETLVENPKGYRQMMELAEKRFSDPADPIHNERLYLAVLKHATESYVLSGNEKEKQRLLLEGAKKNMIGSTAIDFDYVTPKDKTARHLKDLKADYILIYFNNPDCESCEVVKERLAGNEVINKLVNDKKLIVLAIYPYDDNKLWKKTKYPDMMINGWNQSRQIEYNELYDLPTVPCFYLLDGNYTVLLKNEGSLNKVESKLKELTEPQVAGPVAEANTKASTEASIDKQQRQETMKEQLSQKVNAQKGAQEVKKPRQPKQQEVDPSVLKPTFTFTPALADDPKTITSEQVLNYVLNDQSQELYDLLSDKVKSQVQPAMLEHVLTQVESKAGKYQSHDPWEIQETQGMKAYTSILSFENIRLGLIIVYDEVGKMMGFNFVPAQVIGKE